MLALDIPKNVEIFRQRDVRETAVKANTTNYYSIPGSAWTPSNPDTDQCHFINNTVVADADGLIFYAPVNLPHGATVTKVIIYGNAGATAETWTLYATEADPSGNFTMATANFGTADSTISYAIIDNSKYTYWLYSSTIDTNDAIEGGIITYTILE